MPWAGVYPCLTVNMIRVGTTSEAEGEIVNPWTTNGTVFTALVAACRELIHAIRTAAGQVARESLSRQPVITRQTTGVTVRRTYERILNGTMRGRTRYGNNVNRVHLCLTRKRYANPVKSTPRSA
jgi:hypothetical protein